MLFSKSVEYAIQAMIYLARKKSETPIMIREIAEAYGIPHQFLSKIVQTLVKHRILVAVRGRKGGVNLARPAQEIFLPQIIQAIEGPPPEEDVCIFGLDLCSDTQPCPLHDRWKHIKVDIDEMLESPNLAELARRVTEKHEAMNRRRTAGGKGDN
ncbi:MAG: RrF2 family transcriptional regulator [Fidelibacterota bacterium]